MSFEPYNPINDVRVQVAGQVEPVLGSKSAELVAQPDVKKSIPEKIAGAGKSVVDFFTGSEQGLGKNIADIVTSPQAQADEAKKIQSEQEYLMTLVNLRRKAKETGKDTSRYDALIENFSPSEYKAPELPSTGEVALNLAGTAADVLTAGTYGAVKTAGMKTGELAVKATPTVVKIATDVAKSGTKAGTEVAKEVATTFAENKAKKELTKVVDILAPQAENLSLKAKKEAIEQGRQLIKATKTGGTKVSYAPTPEIERASEILTNPKLWKNPVVSKDAPNVIYAKTKSAIARLGQNAETYLGANPVKVSNTEDFNLFKNLRDTAAKSSTASELKAYDEQIKLFQKQLLGRKGGYTTENYYKALKEWEQNIASKLPRGKAALLDPTGVASAKIQAASDVRKAVRDLIGSKHPEFADKMYDIASLYEASDSALLNAAKTKTKSFFQKHPKTTKALQTAGLLGAGGVGVSFLD